MKRSIPDYLMLFIRREGKVVLGKRLSNMWLLTAVLVATFFAIAFANGSLNYLNYKMNDPFIKWVDIKNDNRPYAFDKLRQELEREGVAEAYHFDGYSYDYEKSFNFFGSTDSVRVYMKCRFFDVKNKDLISAILDKENRVSGLEPGQVDDISESSLGVFITEKAARKLGFTDDSNNLNVPAYIDIFRYSPGAGRLGFTSIEDRVRVPVPVLGVVRRLPGSVDLVAFTSLYQQMQADVTFNMNNESYASSLCYFIPEDVDASEFDERLYSLLSARTDADFIIDDQSYDPREMYSYKNRVTETDEDGFIYHYLGFRRVFVRDSVTIAPSVSCEVNNLLLNEFKGKDIHRIYDFAYSFDKLPTGDYLSISFNDLREVRRFAENVVERNEHEIEMSQINAKENFQSVSVMAITLSVVMVIFSIVCILLFIINLLQSYFQKVKRNIGTFKAFGISDSELQNVYLIIILSLVFASLVISLAIVNIVQLILNILDISKGDGFGYLSLWKCDVISYFPPLMTVAAIIVVILSSILTVRLVMKKLLSATPGDLIYDR